MQQRLISENMVQSTYLGQPYFSAHGKYIAYLALSETKNAIIKIKTFSKEIKECQIKLDPNYNFKDDQKRYHFFFSGNQNKSYLIIYDIRGFIVELFTVTDGGKQVIAHKLQTFKKIHQVEENGELLLFIKQSLKDSKQFEIEGYDIGSDKIVPNIGHCAQQELRNGKLINHEGNKIYFLNSHKIQTLKIFSRKSKTSSEYLESTIELDNIEKLIGIYNDRYIFHEILLKQEIQIYDLNSSMKVGKFSHEGEGELTYHQIRGDLLFLVNSNANIDKYHFYSLTRDENIEQKSLVVSHCVYQKGRGNCYQLRNLKNVEACQILQSKGKTPAQNNNNSVSLIYVIPKNKQKIEVMKIYHEKLQQKQFREQRIDMVVNSKAPSKKIHQEEKKKNIQTQQKVQMQQSRLEASISHRKAEKSIEQIQKKLIEQLIDVKMKGIMDKFNRLEQKLINLEEHIVVIYQRIQKEIQNINRQEIKRNVSALFEKVTPQFQTYFNEVFKQISTVMEQGENYYKGKLTKQADMHRDVLSKMVNMTFDATKEIIDLGRKQLKLSENTDQNVEKLIKIYDRWKEDTAKSIEAPYSPSKYKSPKDIDAKISLQSESQKQKGGGGQL